MKSIKILQPNWLKPDNIRAFTTLKGTNLQNLDLPNNKFWITQVHDINILQAKADYYIDPSQTMPPVADGSYTQETNVVCIIKTADCLPILITNNTGTFVAAIHAGWRGLSKGIINNFFKTIEKLDINKNELIFWLGPAIGPLMFEVGEEVVASFDLDHYQSAFIKSKNKYLANIYKIAKINLYLLGINNNQIFSENYCTYSQNDLFCSYRRDNKSDKRMYSLIWID